MIKTAREYKFTMRTPKGWEWLDYVLLPLMCGPLMMMILFKKIFKKY